MATSHGPLQLNDAKAIVSLPERIEVESIARHVILMRNADGRLLLADDLACALIGAPIATLLGIRGARLQDFVFCSHVCGFPTE